jgi:hypothetical protein
VVLAHEAHEAARAIAALLHLAAVCVVNHVLKIDALGRALGGAPHREDLVGADAEVAVGQKAVLRGREAQRAARFVEHDKVVAGSLHLGKANSHRAIIRP